MYHYHTKLMMKEAFSGGRWAWHQDYGYFGQLMRLWVLWTVDETMGTLNSSRDNGYIWTVDETMGTLNS